MPANWIQRTIRRILRPQISLKSLLILMTVCCVLLALWVKQIEPYRAQRSAALMFSEIALTPIQSKPAEGSAWQRWLVTTFVHPEAFVRASLAPLQKTEFAEGQFSRLAALSKLSTLLLGKSSVNDADLAALAPLKQLKLLSLTRCNISDEGFAKIGEKPQLETLLLTGTNVSDASIDQIASYENLKAVYLRWTLVTDAGAERLSQLLPNCEVVHRAR